VDAIVAFGIFLHRPDSIYDDSPAERYQFPSQYLTRVQACVGDWIIYLEPTKVAATRGYFAVAKVQQAIPDPGTPNMYVAVIEPGSYLDFANQVPFRDAGGNVEQGVVSVSGRISGRAQAAVRSLSAADFNRIIARGLADDATALPRIGDPPLAPGMQEDQPPFAFEQMRDRASFITSRLVRDRVFRQVVLKAYDSRCAVTGLKLINGRGRAEVEAAHIRPVEEQGPDIVNNGLSLSGTAHWMFDRGLIGIADDLEILISRKVNDVQGVRGMINPTGRILSTVRATDRPHPHFLGWHRQYRFET
jgi:putative restriction endonuclease